MNPFDPSSRRAVQSSNLMLFFDQTASVRSILHGFVGSCFEAHNGSSNLLRKPKSLALHYTRESKTWSGPLWHTLACLKARRQTHSYRQRVYGWQKWTNDDPLKALQKKRRKREKEEWWTRIIPRRQFMQPHLTFCCGLYFPRFSLSCMLQVCSCPASLGHSDITSNFTLPTSNQGKWQFQWSTK